MANALRPRTGCCCERFSGYDEATGEPVGRIAPHHCCPMHGGGSRERQTAAR